MSRVAAAGAGVLLGFTLGLVCGWAAGRAGRPPDPPVPRAAEGHPTPAVRGAPVTSRAPVVPDCPGQLVVCTRLLEDLEVEAHGSRQGWSEQVPAEYRPESFQATTLAALKACPEFGLSSAGFDCDEPPCIAILHAESQGTMEWTGLVEGCSAWRSVYGNVMQSRSGTLDCGDGRRQGFVLLTTPTEDVLGPARDEEEEADRIRRIGWRNEQIHESLRCDPVVGG